MRKAVGMLITAVCLGLASQAKAAMVETGLTCQTEQQVEQFFGRVDTGKTLGEAIEDVNREAKGPVCGISTVLYVEAETVTSFVSKSGGLVNVKKILVSIISIKGIFVILRTPIPRYAPFVPKGQGI